MSLLTQIKAAAEAAKAKVVAVDRSAHLALHAFVEELEKVVTEAEVAVHLKAPEPAPVAPVAPAVVTSDVTSAGK